MMQPSLDVNTLTLYFPSLLGGGEWDWGLNSGLHIFKAGTLLLEPYLQSILLWLFWRWGLSELFALAGLKS
jgi:hypothetical protein